MCVCVCIHIKLVLTLHYIEGILLNYGEDLSYLLHLMRYHIHEFHVVKVFALIPIKNHVYFNIRIYFFYFIYSFFKIPHIRVSILHYILLKYYFSLFLKLLLFLTHNNHHSLSFYVFKLRKERIKTKYKMNSINVNLHNYTLTSTSYI